MWELDVVVSWTRNASAHLWSFPVRVRIGRLRSWQSMGSTLPLSLKVDVTFIYTGLRLIDDSGNILPVTLTWAHSNLLLFGQ